MEEDNRISSGWTCRCGHTENEGDFCISCGRSHAASENAKEKAQVTADAATLDAKLFAPIPPSAPPEPPHIKIDANSHKASRSYKNVLAVAKPDTSTSTSYSKNEPELTERPQKSTVIAMILAFFLYAGGFYVAGLKKGALLLVGLWILGFVLALISPMLQPIANIVSCVITYKWLKEYNSGTTA